MTGVRLDWESTPLCWIGTSLRILDLSFGSSEVYFENISRSSSDWWVSLLNSNSNLQTLKLSYVKSKGSSIRLVLPNLTSLDLNSMNLEGHCLFFDAHLPKLESLGLDLSSLLDDGNLMEETQSFDHSFFLPILQSCQSTLQSLDIVGQLDSKAASFQKERYRFTRLQTLHLFGTNTIVLDLLSHSQFPRLNNLHTARSLDSPQAAFKILASASLSLEEFGFSEISRTNGQVMPLQYSHDSTQSSFPRLKSLTIRPETAFTKDLFLHATFGELKTLHFILGKSSHQPPFQELVWNDLQCLLRSNASTLKFLWVDGSESKDDNDFDGDQSENSVYLQIPFPQLERMLIESCSNFQIQQILQQPTYYKLADLVIEVYAPISSKFQSELLNLMLRSSATLTYVQISGKVSSDGSGNVSTMGSYLEEETIADGESIEFTLLGELFISGGAALGFLSELSKCSFPELEEFSVPDLPLMDSVLKRIVERSPKLRYLAVTDFEGDPIRDYNIKTNPDMIDELKV